jgi:large subunit ribosomal protein L13
METTSRSVAIIDAEGLLLGRMASNIAKRLLIGEQIVIVNAEKAVISGRKANKVTEAKEFLGVGGVGRGPFHFRRPDRIVRKAVRGMLPVKKPKGKQAYQRLKAFVGVPDAFKGQKSETVADAQATKLMCPHLTVGELAKEIGWNPGE